MHQHHPTLHPMFCFICFVGVVQHRDVVWRGYRLRTGQPLEIPVIITQSVPKLMMPSIRPIMPSPARIIAFLQVILTAIHVRLLWTLNHWDFERQ